MKRSVRDVDLATQDRMATLEARLLARKLRGLSREEVQRVTRTFVAAFLSELVEKGHLDLPTVLSIASIPMDVVIANRLSDEDGEETQA